MDAAPSNDSCPGCRTSVQPTGVRVMGSGFPISGYETETAICANCKLPLRRAIGKRWIFAADWPPWVVAAWQDEKWHAEAHLQWEKLRERFDELDAGVEPTDIAITGIAAYKPRFISERIDRAEQRPVLEALHRLVIKVAEAQRAAGH